MDSKSFEQLKSAVVPQKSKKAKTSEPEVLIIPPNLLEKFGFTFGTLQSSQESCSAITSKTQLHEPHITTSKEVFDQSENVNTRPPVNEETSILETATLMKESVFLSPTFVPTVANVIPGELEIVGPSDKECKSLDDFSLQDTNRFVKPFIAGQNKHNPNDVEPIHNQKSKPHFTENQNYCDMTLDTYSKQNINKFHENCKEPTTSSLNKINSENSILSNNNIVENAIIEQEQNMEKNQFRITNPAINNDNELNIIENTVVEKISTQLAPSIFEYAKPKINVEDQCSSVHLKQESQCKPQNKIEIISEEILHPHHKISKPIKDNCIVVTMDTLIAGRGKSNSAAGRSDINHINTNQKYESLKDMNLLNKDSKMVLHNNEVSHQTTNEHCLSSIKNSVTFLNNESISGDDKEEVISYKYGKDSIVKKIIQPSTSVNNNTINSYNAHNILEKMYCDIVSKTDFDYLTCKNELIDKLNTDEKYTNVNAEDNSKCHLLNEEDKSSSQFLFTHESHMGNAEKLIKGQLKLKACVQGIEKPGGGNTELKNAVFNIKTYLPKKIDLPVKTASKVKKEVILRMSNNIKDITLSEAVSYNTALNSLEYCSCADFGRLSNDGYVHSPYEHIHFWHASTVNCDPEIIYGLYHDDALCIGQGVCEEAKNIDDNEISSICWNSIHVQSYKNIFEKLYSTSKLSKLSEDNYIKDEENKIADTNLSGTKIIGTNAIKSLPTEIILENNCIKSSDLDVKQQSPDPFQILQKESNCVKEEKQVENYSMCVLNQESDDNIHIVPKLNKISDATVSKYESKHCKIEKDVRGAVENAKESSDPRPLIHVKAEYEKEHPTNFTNAKKIKCESPKKVYPHIGTAPKRNFNDSIVSDTQSVVKKRCNNQRDPSDVKSPAAVGQELMKIKCTLCDSVLLKAEWESHILRVHMKWNITHFDDLQNDDFHAELYKKVNLFGILKCEFCNFKVNHVPTFILHAEKCIPKMSNRSFIVVQPSKSAKTSSIKSPTKAISPNKSSLVTCGVCKNVIDSNSWIDHIRIHHNYLAWKDGEPKLDCNNGKKVQQHLQTIIKQFGPLVCSCNVQYTMAHVKLFLTHKKTCGKKESSDNLPTIDVACEIDTIKLKPDNNIDCNSEISMEVPELPDQLQNPETAEAGSITEINKLFVECGVCKTHLDPDKWMSHIEVMHYYLAWKSNEKPLDINDKDEILKHLKSIVAERKILVCVKCGETRRYPKSYLSHINKCTDMFLDISQLDNQLDESSNSLHERPKRARLNSSSSDMDDNLNLLALSKKRRVVCGVCTQEVKKADWITHIEQNHNYLAWKENETPLDLANEDCVRQHLHSLSKQNDGLLCIKCNSRRKHVKAYLEHVRTCSVLNNDSPNIEDGSNSSILNEKTIKCGVCSNDIQESVWFEHICDEHNYLAWMDGEPALDVNDQEAIKLHLHMLSKKLDGLKCAKCKCVRRYAKSYMEHIKSCKGPAITVEVTVENVVEPSDTSDENVVCGICKHEMKKEQWITHIQENHNYLAWIEGKPVLDLENEEVVRQHLFKLTKELNGLTCSKCNCIRKYAKNFLEHVKNCGNLTESDEVEQKPTLNSNVIPMIHDKDVTCGVCKVKVEGKAWFSHIENEHQYLAWIDGSSPLNIEDEECVRQHLTIISKTLDRLICSKCGAKRKYVKPYMEHLKHCTGIPVEETVPLLNNTNFKIDMENEVKCGVCYKVIQPGCWIKHIQVAHNYLAWVDGDDIIDENNEKMVHEHLSRLLKYTPTLICAKCGYTRRNVRHFHDHMKTCDSKSEGTVVCEDEKSLLLKNKGMYECAICHEKVLPKKWENHAMDKHYNVTWAVGDIPINLKSPYGADRHLKKYKEKKGKLICNNCGASRASLMGFYVHVITCGKTDEETAMFKDECEICGKLYLAVYKSQHMTMHKEQELAKQAKELGLHAPERVEEQPELPSGRRRAAEKANSVIEKYSTNEKEFYYNCATCGFGTDVEKQLNRHKCSANSALIPTSDESSEESSDCSDYSNASEDQQDITKKKGTGVTETPRPSWLPFQLVDPKEYLERTVNDFRAVHFTNEILFADWMTSSYECLTSKHQITKYTPKLNESCKVNCNNDFSTYNRFEGKYCSNVFSMFVGGSIQCISWAPSMVDENYIQSHYLAVTSHLDSDIPRLNCDAVAQHPGLIQIWDFGIFDSAPKFVLGLAHDYGTVWSMDWCPSGARCGFDAESEDKKWCRLGLLAIACSNGSVYILSIPYPGSLPISTDNIFCKLKPVAELRFRMKTESKMFQATSISWSKKKGHAVVVVGYSDGHIASFDLTNESPLLKSTENDMVIYYPYHDERTLNACVTGMDTFPAQGEWLNDAVCASSPTGAAVVSARGGRVAAKLAAGHSAFAPGWPVAMLGGDDGILNQSPNEVEWHGPGRRLGPLVAGAGCGRCGQVLMFAPPHLRTTRLFPPCTELHKKIIALVNIKPLRIKRKKKKYQNDELSMTVEPITYSDAAKKFSLEFTIVAPNYKPGVVSKEVFPERFPLADVTSLAYCPSGKYHSMAAVATYAGVIFVFETK